MEKKEPIITFATSEEWAAWLAANHQQSEGIWIKFAKKASGILSITPQEALEVALCYGWIDGQRNQFDDNHYLNKYCHRTAKSIWSKRNCGIALQLIKDKKMQAEGLAEIERAKEDGRWERAYDSPANMQIPEDFIIELKKNKQAQAFFQTLNKTNTFAIAFRLQTAKKPETRQRRMEKILAMMAEGKKFY
ncbi:MAG: YdeI/OmpD-associated family protein [Bacteroidetes bacterium]|nr:YdeI/OmpD-associated family protein [Bacteroidota bacterium]